MAIMSRAVIEAKCLQQVNCVYHRDFINLPCFKEVSSVFDKASLLGLGRDYSIFHHQAGPGHREGLDPW